LEGAPAGPVARGAGDARGPGGRRPRGPGRPEGRRRRLRVGGRDGGGVPRAGRRRRALLPRRRGLAGPHGRVVEAGGGSRPGRGRGGPGSGRGDAGEGERPGRLAGPGPAAEPVTSPTYRT